MRPHIKQRSISSAAALAGAGVPPLLQRIYTARGISQPHGLDLSLQKLLPPTAMKGLKQAAELLADAIEGEASVVIVGDFDADGATSSALAVSVLRQMGLSQVSYLVPNRFEFGYGLSPEIVGIAAARQPDLIVTVDNGISSLEGVIAAQALGISVLITDHHLPGDELPSADVIVNPNQPGCAFPSKNLAGVGVMFYVLTALRAELRQRNWFETTGIAPPNLGDALDLVALGTIADVVPLDHNNRILVAAGLARIRNGRSRPGIEALLEVAGRDMRKLSSSDLGFAIGPRLNAAGRLEDMSIGIECLLAESTFAARPLAEQLSDLNRERQDIERGMSEEALSQMASIDLGDTALPFGIVLHDPHWHQGVVGILASRIRERYHRPTIIFADAGEGELKGSGRSLPGVHIRDILDRVASQNPGLVNKFGGHAMAAGLTLDATQLSTFSEAFDHAVAESLKQVPPELCYDTDGELSAADLSLVTAELLAAAGPWGQQFPEPAFEGVFTVLEQRIVGEKHLKLTLQCERTKIDAIAFNVDLTQWPAPSVTEIGAIYRLDINEFRGDRKSQLIIETLWAMP